MYFNLGSLGFPPLVSLILLLNLTCCGQCFVQTRWINPLAPPGGPGGFGGSGTLAAKLFTQLFTAISATSLEYSCSIMTMGLVMRHRSKCTISRLSPLPKRAVHWALFDPHRW